MKKPKKVKRQWKFSERLIVAILIYAMTIFERGLVFAFINHSENLFAYLMPVIGTLITASFLAFEWKEKNENINKQNLNPDYLKSEFQAPLPPTNLTDEQLGSFERVFEDTSGD